MILMTHVEMSARGGGVVKSVLNLLPTLLSAVCVLMATLGLRKPVWWQCLRDLEQGILATLDITCSE